MSSPSAAAAEAAPSSHERLVNDFSIEVATVNGTGSQTANNTLIRAIMRMGIPVSGKNIFPSNIQGLPTWFTIRVCESGWLARTRRAEVVICLNRATAQSDADKAPPGACLIYDAAFRIDLRDDLRPYPVPFGKLIKECCPKPKLWRLVTNMLYVGVVAELLDIELESCEAALGKLFENKPKAIELNVTAIRHGAGFAREQFPEKPGYRVERRDLTAGKILIDGNSAAALGALMGGCTVLTWYPITPSSSVAESLNDLLEKYRRDDDGKGRFAMLQAEDELAAAGMVLGAGWAGARSMTTTSGAGISLMSEFIGLGYHAEIPGVFVNVQRTGPSTGLPTRTQQSDLLLCAYNSHGDTKHPMTLPASPREAYELMAASFDLSERFQTPVFFMSDLDLGMNNWLCDPFPYLDQPFDRGKVADAEVLERIGIENWGRYKDLDGDGIPYRTLPGLEVDGAAYFTRGSGHDEYARYTESSPVYQANMERLLRKWETLKEAVPAPELSKAPELTRVGVLAYGTSHWAMLESRVQLRKEHGVEFDYLRVKAFPFPSAVDAFFDAHDRVYVVDQNRDGQMATLLRTENPALSGKIRSLCFYDGMPLDAQSVTEALAAAEAGQEIA
jgi:2-oxoglutarate/2-oxoacid ferredoxin oxidoreductase subunit alpha